MAIDLELADSLAKIRKYHRLGSDVADTKYGAMGSEAERLGLNIDYMRASRRFAEMYAPDEVNRLCKACVAGGYAIGWARMMLLLTVSRAAERESLLKKAIKGNWSKSQLQAEIRRRYGNRAKKGAGRPTKLAGDGSPDTSYEKALRLCSQFESFMHTMRRQGQDERTPLDQLPPSTRACMVRAEETMAALRLAVAKKVTG